MDWKRANQQEKIVAIKREIAAGAQSGNDIAARLGVSRNTIGGMCDRHGIALPGKWANLGGRSRKKRSRRRSDVRDARIVAQKSRVSRPAKVKRRRRGRRPNIFTIHPTRDCHFPLWGNERGIDVEDKKYCGEPVALNADDAPPYCDDCFEVMHRAPSFGERKASGVRPYRRA